MLSFTTWEAWKKATEERGLIVVQELADSDPTGENTPTEAYDPKFCTMAGDATVYDPQGAWGFYDHALAIGYLYENDEERSYAWLGGQVSKEWED